MQDLSIIIDELRDEMIRTLKGWIQVPSVKAAPEPGAPFGREVRRALDLVLSDAAAMGFETRNFDGYAGDVRMGPLGVDPLAILVHLDVVPAAADAAEGNNKRDPRSGNIDFDLRLQAALQFPPFGIRHYGKQHGLLRGLQPKGVQDLRSRRSAAQRLEGYGYSVLLIKGQKAPRLVPVTDDRHKV